MVKMGVLVSLCARQRGDFECAQPGYPPQPIRIVRREYHIAEEGEVKGGWRCTSVGDIRCDGILGRLGAFVVFKRLHGMAPWSERIYRTPKALLGAASTDGTSSLQFRLLGMPPGDMHRGFLPAIEMVVGALYTWNGIAQYCLKLIFEERESSADRLDCYWASTW
ncbi:hypothetical protein EJ04DRAFT_271274 [Polyplosphaeria fusca]|uniref:Uncharacterized protein n=1 Tax=Polyplosphaeria fusca TaxID=682080 RepID=A0A9P4QYG5_9PLEO|nr:hypothetical protein EJ04DRAFT_271274 [Polyplosphaeria fusca]